MKMSLCDVCIVIPTKRPPPLQTLASHQFPRNVPIFLLADPSLYLAHRKWYAKHQAEFPQLRIVKGKSGLVAQVRFCYRYARQQGYHYAFRLDDDSPPHMFVHKNRSHPSLTRVMRWARRCTQKTGCSLVGFATTSRTDWLGRGFNRSYATNYGGAQLFDTSVKINQILPANIACYEDIYRSCSHRKRDGAIGRVNFVGLHIADGMKNTVNEAGKAKWKKGMHQLIDAFPDFGTFQDGDVRTEKGLPRFRPRRHKAFRKER